MYAENVWGIQKEDKYELLSYLSDHEEYIKNTDLSFNGPVQLIWGQEDQLIPLSTAYQLKAFYPKASLAILPNVGHVANMENPLEVARIIKKFAL